MPTQPAILGRARLNNFRLNYLPLSLKTVRDAKVGIWIGGADARTRTRIGSAQIQDVLNDAPNAASFTVEGVAPAVGQDVRITVNVNAPRVLFHGTMQSVELSYEGRAHLSVWKCTAADDLSRANLKRPFGTWSQISASQIALQLMTNFAPGITTQFVQQGLPPVSITFDGTETMGTCLKRLATLIGGYFYIENLDLHLFQAEFIDPPDPIMAGYPFLADPRITQTTNLSQIRTRNYGKGHGEQALTDIVVGETIIPLADAVMFNAAGGTAMAATARDGTAHQKLTYTGTIAGGSGSIVGPPVIPSAALTPTLSGSGPLTAGVYKYAYTFVTATGETAPGPLASITTGVMAPPLEPGFSGPSIGGSLGQGFYKYGITFVTAAGETTPSGGGLTSIPTTAGDRTWLLMFIQTGSAAVIARNIYRTTVNGTQLRYLTQINNNTATTFSDGNPDTVLGANAPTVNTAGSASNSVFLSNIGIGPAATTARRIYRTAVNGSQLKLQQTLGNNTATTGATDATADGSLGANAPAGDTSGISTTAGQVNAGATSIVTANPSAFASGGGWVILSGNQMVRYTGVTGNSLTGIPASGPGAIMITVLYGSQITIAACLIGVVGVQTAMEKGSMIHLWIQVDDIPAQDEMKALDLAQGRTSDGIYEYVIQDDKRSEASLRDLCTADLKLFSRPIVTVRYATRDQKTKAGKTIAVSLTQPPIVANLVIQDVTIDELEIAQGLSPKFTVSASSVRFSLDDLLRQLAVAAGGNG